jgi:hypothetical protein
MISVVEVLIVTNCPRVTLPRHRQAYLRNLEAVLKGYDLRADFIV